MEILFYMNNILLTGVTGSLCSALAPKLLAEGYNIVGLSRDLHKQSEMKRKYPEIQFVLGDICNRDLMIDLCQEADIVVHAAALKIVGDAEKNVTEYNRVNVLGALCVGEACRLTGVERALLISSDKACQPAQQTYGKTKALAESLWLSQNTNHRHSKFSVLRYGNVVSSRASVWHIWNQAIAEGEDIIVKYPEPTRFILTMDQAIWMVEKSIELMNGGEIFVPGNVPSFSLWDLAHELVPDAINWVNIPLLPGEKQHEIMVAPQESVEPLDVSDGKITLWKINPKKTSLVQETPPMFSSLEANRITGKQVIEMLTNVSN